MTKRKNNQSKSKEYRILEQSDRKVRKKYDEYIPKNPFQRNIEQTQRDTSDDIGIFLAHESIFFAFVGIIITIISVFFMNVWLGSFVFTFFITALILWKTGIIKTVRDRFDKKYEQRKPSQYQYEYKAFISYNLNDIDFTKKIHRSLLQHTAKDEFKFFRDRTELEANSSFNQEIDNALDNSEWLIVICSPNARKANYVNRECDYFANELQRKDKTICVIASNAPNEKNIKQFYPPSIEFLSSEYSAIDTRKEAQDWNMCIAKIVCKFYNQNLKECYEYIIQQKESTNYNARLKDIAGLIENKYYAEAEELMRTYTVQPQYDIRGFEWDYLMSVSSRKCEKNFLMHLENIPINTNFHQIAFDKNRNLIYWGNSNGQISVFDIIYKNVILENYRLQVSPIQKLIAKRNGNLLIYFENGTLEERIFSDHKFLHVGNCKIKNTFLKNQSPVFDDFHSAGYAPLIEMNETENLLAISTGASITVINLETYEKRILNIPDETPWKVKLFERWDKILFHDTFLVVINEKRILAWDYKTEYLFLNYRKKHIIEPIEYLQNNIFYASNNFCRIEFVNESDADIYEPNSQYVLSTISIEEKKNIISFEWLEDRNERWLIAHYNDGKRIFYCLTNNNTHIHIPPHKSESSMHLRLTDHLYIEKDTKYISLWENKVNIEIYGKTTMFSLLNNILFSIVGHKLNLYDLNCNLFQSKSLKISNPYGDFKYDVNDKMNLMAFVLDNGDSVHLYNIASDEKNILKLYHDNESNILRKMLNRANTKERHEACCIKWFKENLWLIGCTCGKLLLWDGMSSHKEIADHAGKVQFIIVSSNKRDIVSIYDNEVFIHTYNEISIKHKQISLKNNSISNASFIDDNKIILLSENGTVNILNIHNIRENEEIKTYLTNSRHIVCTNDETIFIIASNEISTKFKSKLTFWSKQENRALFCEHFEHEIHNLYLSKQDTLIIVFEDNCYIRQIQKDTLYPYPM